MIAALGLALGDLADRAVIAVLARSLAATLLIFAGVGIASAWVLDGADPCGLLGEAACPLSPAEGMLGALFVGTVALWLLFPAVAIGVMSAFADRVVGAVERRHYPLAAVKARPPGAFSNIALGLRSGLRLLVLNLLALPGYVLLLATGIGPVLLFVAVNGVALARDLGEIVAPRHLDGPARRAWYRASRGDRLLLGMTITGLFLVPVANLFAPVLGTAAATHLFHRARRPH